MPAWNKINIPKNKLKKLYLDRELSIAKIANTLGYSTSSVHRSLQDYKIPIRNLSEACTKIKVSKQELKKWYFGQKLSMFEIANKLGCSHSSIVLKFQRLGLRSRGQLGLTRPIRLTRKGLEYLYCKKGLSLGKIARIVHCSEGGLERRFKKYYLVSRGIKNRACKYKKDNFSGDPVEKAYLIGFRLGDLNIMKRVNVIQVRCSTTIPAQVKLIKSLFAKYTTPHIWKARRGTTEIVCLVNKSFNFLIPKKDKVPTWILKNSRTFWSFFAGYADAEGWISISRNTSSLVRQRVDFGISTYDNEILSTMGERFKKFSVRSRFYLKSPKGTRVGNTNYFSNGDAWCLAVSTKQSLWNLIQYWKLYSKHNEKIKRTKLAERNLIKRNEIKRSRPINLQPITL